MPSDNLVGIVMADPLSITASIIAVLQLTSSILQVLNDVQCAYEGHAKLHAEIKSAKYILETLKNLSQDDKLGFAWEKTLLLLEDPIKDFSEALETLLRKLKPAHGVKKIGQAISFPFEKKEVTSILQSIERQKSLFALAIQNDHM